MIDKGVPFRLVVYTLATGYMMLDLMVFQGPLHRHFNRKAEESPEQIAAAKARGVVAMVYSQPILLTQVDRRVEQDLWKEGRSLEEISAEEKILRRKAALGTLIDLHLLGRIKVLFNSKEYPVSEEEIDQAVARFVSRFPNPEELKKAMDYQGWSEKELRYRLAARMQQEDYLEALIGSEVSEEEARAWYEEHKERLALPERVRARHVFLATLNRESEEARGILAKAKQELADGKSFAELVKRLSEDERTKSKGGELGWMQADRMPDDFAVSVFDLSLNKPSLVRTKIGWHLIEVTERNPAEERSFEDAKEEVVAALEAGKRKEGLELYLRQLREFEKSKVEIFEEVLVK